MAIALALATHKLARVPHLQPDPPDPPEEPDPRRRHLLEMIEAERELDELVDTEQVEPWEVELGLVEPPPQFR
jgi:hypothetical protein